MASRKKPENSRFGGFTHLVKKTTSPFAISFVEPFYAIVFDRVSRKKSKKLEPEALPKETRYKKYIRTNKDTTGTRVSITEG
jgi:hypothetical protein